jgi:hypothetical protein
MVLEKKRTICLVCARWFVCSLAHIKLAQTDLVELPTGLHLESVQLIFNLGFSNL